MSFNMIVPFFFPHSRTVHLDTIQSFVYSTDAQLDCSKHAKIYIKIYIKIYMEGAPSRDLLQVP